MDQVFQFFKNVVSGMMGIFSEQKPASMIRFLSFLMFGIATDLTYKLILTRTGELGQYDFYTILSLYSLAFFPKVIQKYFEKRITPTNTDIQP
ncbi:MAG: hypothetical protein Q8R96_11585 [Bacteroidota bacterium]|nr:hypothetical protein [Bacteroidota bacterium]